jgi:hypothetical protein
LLALSNTLRQVRLPSNDLQVKVAGQASDFSNTPIVRDSVGWTSRDYGVHHYIGIVAFIDVLGMKRMSERYKLAQIVNKWKKVIGSFRNVLQEGSLNAGYFFRVLSDTIIITKPTELNQYAINETFNLLLQPFIHSIKTGIPFLLRGILSHGDYYLSQYLIIGPAVNEAASYHDQLNWIGIALSPKVPIGNTVNNSVVYYNYIPLKDRHIPLKDRHYRGIALNWPKFDLNRECNKILQKEHFKADALSKKKYVNTFSFYDYVSR